MRDKIGAPLGPGRRDDQPAPRVIERAHHRDLLRPSGRRNPKVRAFLGPGARQIGMRQRLALIGKQQHDVASLGLRLEQFQAQTAAVRRRGGASACGGIGDSESPLFAKRRGELRLRDSHALLRCYLIGQTRQGPVDPVRHRRRQERLGNAQGRLRLHRLRPRQGPGFQGLDAAAHEFASPQADGVFAHAVGFRNARTGPALERQQDASGPVRLGPVPAPPAFASSSLTCFAVALTGDLPAILNTPIRPIRASESENT
jgi:hypothetical protein